MVMKMCEQESKWQKIEEEFLDEGEDSGFGTCEECGIELTSMPNGAWGVGYVCEDCAHKLRGEYEL